MDTEEQMVRERLLNGEDIDKDLLLKFVKKDGRNIMFIRKSNPLYLDVDLLTAANASTDTQSVTFFTDEQKAVLDDKKGGRRKSRRRRSRRFRRSRK